MHRASDRGPQLAGFAAVAALCSVAAVAAAADTPARTAAAAAPAARDAGLPAPAAVGFRPNGEQRELTDAAGYTLYTYIRDVKPGESTCFDDCAKNWPPLEAAAGSQPIGDFALVQRPDGRTQWSYRGQPLYRYAADEYPGAAFGDGLRNLWRVASVPLLTPPGVSTGLTRSGRVLVDEKGHTLYTLRRGADGRIPECDTKCLGAFVPLKAPGVARPVGDWTTVAVADGSAQWAYKGSPLFRFRDDRRPGDNHGEGAAGNRWTALVVQPPAKAPDWVRYANADMGIVYAGPDGRTLYTFRGNRKEIVQRICDEACIKARWEPFYADKPVPPAGDWAVKPGDDGRLQWSYRGSLLYTYRDDRRPGDTLGDNFGASWNIDGPWKPILRWQY